MTGVEDSRDRAPGGLGCLARLSTVLRVLSTALSLFSLSLSLCSAPLKPTLLEPWFPVLSIPRSFPQPPADRPPQHCSAPGPLGDAGPLPEPREVVCNRLTLSTAEFQAVMPPLSGSEMGPRAGR